MKISPSVKRRIIEKNRALFPKKRFVYNDQYWAQIREVAFHEAGHVSARLFLGLEPSDIISVSIIPDRVNEGRVRTRQMVSEELLKSYDEPMRRALGMTLLLWMLAGRVAQSRVASVETREKIIDRDSLEWDKEGTDLYRVARISSTMQRKGMPQGRILNLAEKWTAEMMSIQIVWETTEKIAVQLLKCGTLRRPQIFKLCDEIADMSLSLHPWDKRLHGL